MYIDNIRDIVRSLTEDEKKEFRAFINRQRVRKNRKDLDLFEIMCEDEVYKARDIVERLYGKINMNAYHSIRKRLLKHLMDFVVIKRMDMDTTASSSVMGLLSISQFLFDNSNNRTAWHYLVKAEELAINNELYDLLDNIYNVQIANASDANAPELNRIIERWKENKRLADEDERANVAATIMKMELSKAKLNADTLDLEKEVAAVMKEYNLDEATIERPKLLYNILSIVRSAVLVQKQYFKFEPLVIEKFEQVKSSIGFQKKDHFYKLSILYMICHVLYRNRKFDEALVYLEEFLENIQQYNRSYYVLFYPKYALLYSATRSYMGYNEMAIKILEETFEKDVDKFAINHKLDMKLNLAVYYFQQEDYRSANKVLHSFQHTDGWCQKKMGKEWVARKNLIEIIVQFEMGNVEIALNRIRSFERLYADFLKLPMYARTKTFLGFIKVCIDKPYWISTEEFTETVTATIERWPFEQEDLQAMAFFCWLKAKMLKKGYYQVLVETVHGRLQL